MTLFTFVCFDCSGLLRQYNFRIKSLSASVFSDQELENIKKNGNDVQKKVWLANWNEQIPTDRFQLETHLQKKYQLKKYHRNHNNDFIPEVDHNAPRNALDVMFMDDKSQVASLKNPFQMNLFGEYRNVHNQDLDDDETETKPPPQWDQFTDFSRPKAISLNLKSDDKFDDEFTDFQSAPSVPTPIDQNNNHDPYAAFRDMSTQKSSLFF
jgi:hypothetical protein